MRRRLLLRSALGLIAAACGSARAPETTAAPPSPSSPPPHLPTSEIPPPPSRPPNPYGVVDASGLEGRILFGYQGWFRTGGDGSRFVDSWHHWALDYARPKASTVGVDNWPDLSELGTDELFPTELRYRDGTVARVFSNYQRTTTVRHFKWMGEYGIDGVLLQRFPESPWDPRALDFRDVVTKHVMEGCETFGRVFAVEYDVSSMRAPGIVRELQSDWQHQVEDLGVIDSPRYLRHRGKPLLGLWGLGFGHVAVTPEQADELISWFTRDAPPRYQVTLLGGVPWSWRTNAFSPHHLDARWPTIFRRFDVICPWYVGPFNASAGDFERHLRTIVLPDIAAAREAGRDFMPVIFPGFSWANLSRAPGRAASRYNAIPRSGGQFWWQQLYEYMRGGAKMFKGAMFDELDEGTAMFKLARTAADAPAEPGFVALDADGLDLPSDWYLRVAREGQMMLRGQRPPTATVPIRP